MKSDYKIILGSSSLYRQQILKEMGYEFEVITPDIDEKAIRRTDPKDLVLLLSNAKADAIVQKVTEPSLIITSDQVGSCNNTIREKPNSVEEVYSFYELYAKYPLETITAVTVTNTGNGRRESGVDIVKTYLAPIPESVIQQLIDDGQIFKCAGAIRFEDPLIKPFIKSMEGTLDSSMGLPKTLTESLIRRVQ